MSAAADRWALAIRAVLCLAEAPSALGGIVIRARSGPVRDRLLDVLRETTDRPIHRLPPGATAEALHGGLDLTETLRTGRSVSREGLLARASGGILIAPMAERMRLDIAAQIAVALDGEGEAPPTLVLLDEGAEPDEVAPDALRDRLGLHIALDDIALADTEAGSEIIAADAPDAEDPLPVLTSISAAYGILSMRVPVQALAAARALAALDGCATPTETHLGEAAALSILPRARTMPQTAQDEPDDTPNEPEPEEQPESDPNTQQDPSETAALEDRVLEAAAAVLPELNLTARRDGASGAGAGARMRTVTHGRPAGTMAGKIGGGRRLDIVATLRTAAPWQPLRRKVMTEARDGVLVEPDDFRIKRFERPAESVMIFVVDASGSAAAARMAEAKGAIEIMLAEAYRKREKVALIAFRGSAAEVLLQPTRALVQAKRQLSTLPGGGGTPLAAGILTAHGLAQTVRRSGATPYLVFLTDGRGNIALSGEPGRAQAREDQDRAARMLAADGVVTVLIDTANRPQPDAKVLAAAMDARYLPLPRADASMISRAVRAVTDA